MTEALIFDCDGTLADTMPAHYRAWLEVLRPYGIPFPEERFYALGGAPTFEIARLLATDAGVDLDLRKIVKAKEDAFLDEIAAIVPIEKVVSVARARRGSSPMAVASGGQRRTVASTLRHPGHLRLVRGARDRRGHREAQARARRFPRGRPPPRRAAPPPGRVDMYGRTPYIEITVETWQPSETVVNRKHSGWSCV